MPSEPRPVPIAERRVAQPVRMRREVLEVQELERHRRSPQLLMNPHRIRLCTRRRARMLRTAVEPTIELGLAHRLQLLPRQPRLLRPLTHLADHTRARTRRARHFTHAQAQRPAQSQDLLCLAHRQSLHLSASSEHRDDRSDGLRQRLARDPMAAFTPADPLSTHRRSGCPRPGDPAVHASRSRRPHAGDPTVHAGAIWVSTCRRSGRPRVREIRRSSRPSSEC